MRIILDAMVILMFVACLSNPNFDGSSRLLLMVLSCGLFALLAGWPRRIKQHLKRKELLALPQHTVEGILSAPLPFNTGKHRSVPVSTGYSQEIGGKWSLYSHYTYSSRPVYEGQYVKLMYVDDTIIFRSLPASFFSNMEQIPIVEGAAKITYVTDSDGTNYFISAIRA